MLKFYRAAKAGLVTVSALLCLSVFSQNSNVRKLQESARMRILSDKKVDMLGFSTDRGTPHLIAFRQDVKAYSAAQSSVVLQGLLALRPGIDALRMEKQQRLQNNQEVIEYQQYYKGVKVDRARYKALINNGELKLYNGAYYNIPPSASVTPSLTARQALSFAKAKIGASEYVEDMIQKMIERTSQQAEKNALQKELKEIAPKGELVFVQDYSNKNETDVRLAYKFNIYAARPLSRSWVYVDAMNGKILLVDAIIKHASVPVTVQTRYAGARTIYVKNVSGNDPNNELPLVSSHPASEVYVPGSATNVLIDDTRGNGVETYDLNGVGGLPISMPPAYTLAKSFTDVDNNWTLPEHMRGGGTDGPMEAENDDIAWDAHWGAALVYDYWKNKQNRLSFDGNDAKIKSYIHSGLIYDNAFWNGSVMTYGDGSGTGAGGFKPLTSLDVCGHEIGHGVCEFTSNLVYANESGAMNEALSDIWASCIEVYAIKRVDPSLKSIYKPFYIGEQISASASNPLRRMDDPKATGNPDTYGGVNWTNTDGCTPTLINDQCGVHNNSGVLNKWFYLLTVGSGAGSGPDASYAGVDDGINDLGNTYSVTGLGFDVSEKITFLMETMLSSAATYAEARTVAISVATQLSGNPCSAMVEAVTNAWYAVGVGSKFVKPCTVVYGFPVVSSAGTTEAATPSGCNSFKTFNVPVIMPPNSTATGALSGTATNGIDYALSSYTLSNTSSSVVKKDLVVTIRNDAAVEGDETVIINVSITNTGSNPVNKTYTLTILDDDVLPVIGSGQKTLLSNTFTASDGFADPGGWTEILEIPEAPDGDPTASGKNQWGIWNNRLAVTGKDGLTGITLPANTYNNLSNSQTLIKSPLIDARGLSVLNISFDYTVQGELDLLDISDPENFPAYDYMAVTYSLDGVNFIELTSDGFRQFAALAPTSGTFSAKLPAALTNKKFYLAFRWFDDTNAGGPYSVSIDNLLVTGTPRTIENTVSHNGREYLSPYTEAYFFSVQDGELVGRAKNNSNKDFGCTNTYVEKSGTGAFNLYQGTDGLHKVSDKLIRIEASSIYKVSNTVSVYFTEDQLQGLEAATAKSRTSFSVYVVDAASYTGATSANTKRYAATYTPISGTGGYYTFTFTGKINGSYALGTIVSQPGLRTTPITQSDANWKFRNIYPNPVSSSLLYAVTAPAEQKVRVDIVNLAGQLLQTQAFNLSKGYTNLRVQASSLVSGSYFIYLKNAEGKILNIQKFNKR